MITVWVRCATSGVAYGTQTVIIPVDLGGWRGMVSLRTRHAATGVGRSRRRSSSVRSSGAGSGSGQSGTHTPSTPRRTAADRVAGSQRKSSGLSCSRCSSNSDHVKSNCQRSKSRRATGTRPILSAGPRPATTGNRYRSSAARRAPSRRDSVVVSSSSTVAPIQAR